MNELIQAKLSDASVCYAILNAGRCFQQSEGFVQWDEEYPSLPLVQNDIQNEKGYILKIDGAIAAYVYIDCDGDPDYDSIVGPWVSNRPYAAVHRLAFHPNFRNRGLASVVAELIEQHLVEKGIHSMRVDTGAENKRMQHVLNKIGFSYCGTVTMRGASWVLYQKDF